MIAVTGFAGAKDEVPAGVEERATWSEVAAGLVGLLDRESPELAHIADPAARRKAQKLSLPYVGPYRLRSGASRSDDAVEALTLLVEDLDRCDLDATLDALRREGVAALVYESPSSAPGAPRVRIVCPVARPILPAESAQTRLAFAERLGLEPGCGVEGTLPASIGFFFGRCFGDPPRRHWLLDGAPVDVDALVAAPLRQPWKVPAPKRPTAALERRVPTPQREPTDRCRALAAAMSERWLRGDREANNFEKSFYGWLLKADWSREEVAALLALLDAEEPDAEKRAEHARKLAAARKLSGLAPAVAQWFEYDFDRIDAIVNRPPTRAVAPAPREEIVEAHFDTNRQGELRTTHDNASIALAAWFGERLRLETFSGRILVAGVDDSLGAFPDGEWSDEHTTEFVRLCERMRLFISPAVAERALAAHAKRNCFNAVADYLLACAAQWDGLERVDTALSVYWGARDSAATRATSRVFLRSLAARGISPGQKVDTCPILIGPQGARKSSSFRALVGDEWFSDSPLPIGDKDAQQNIRGVWLWEFGENASISRRERNLVKAFLSQMTDRFRPSFGRHPVTVPRGCCFVASSNDDDVLTDPTGNRRFLPVRVGAIDLERLRADARQLLGEAATAVAADLPWWPTREDELELDEVRADHMAEPDVIVDAVRGWLAKAGDRPVTVPAILASLYPMSSPDKREQARVAEALRALGFGRERRRVDGERAYVWTR